MAGDPARLVLVAEHSEELSGMLRSALEASGYSVVTAADGFEAVSRAFEQRPRAILLDLQLHSIDGLRLCRYFRNDPSLCGVPILVLSASRGRSARKRSLRAGADAFLELPLLPGALEAVISGFAGNGGTAVAEDLMPSAPPSRETVLETLESLFERRTCALEEVWDLAEDLSGLSSKREIFRRIATGVLTGLGYDRVMVADRDEATGELSLEVALGPGLGPSTSRAVLAADGPSGSPVAKAISEKRLVRSMELREEKEVAEDQLSWAGSLDFIDVPLLARNRVLGLVRCDRWPSGRPLSPQDIESLDFYARLASAHLASVAVSPPGVLDPSAGTMLASGHSALIVLDENMRIVRSSGPVEELFGRGGVDGSRAASWESIPMLSREGRPEAIRRALREGEDWLEKAVPISLAGQRRVFIDLRFLPLGSPGRRSGVAIVAEDVTHEQELAEDLQRKNDELELVAGIGRELNSILNVDQILRKLSQVLARFFPDVYVSILLPTEDECQRISGLEVEFTSGYPVRTNPKGLTLRVSSSSEEDEAQASGEAAAGMSARPQGIVGAAVMRGEAVNIADVTQEASYVENISGTKSELCVPMMVRNRIVGVIDLQSETPSRFDENAVRQVRTLANMAAPALENATLHEKVQQMALTDELTGLKNLRYFESRLDEELDRAVRYNYPFSLIVLDIDDFKNYNDSFGHPMGNVIIGAVAGAIRNALRETDILVRFGGDEFVCILPLTGAKEAAEIGERARKRVEGTSAPHVSELPSGRVTVSVGVATFPSDVSDRDQLLQTADERMYEAKKAGKNRVCSGSGA
ncbi:diguanylate cyclase [Candidatus Fermentibacterales bacterium]|nr:diguanylate cyclase [Candidatus Fermentibacterales bacterium]